MGSLGGQRTDRTPKGEDWQVHWKVRQSAKCHPGAGDGRLHGSDVALGDGLREDALGSSVVKLRDECLGDASRHAVDDDGRLESANQTARRHAVEVGHRVIHERRIDVLAALQELDGFPAVREGHGGEAGLAQDSRYRHADDGLVVDHEDDDRRAPGRRRRPRRPGWRRLLPAPRLEGERGDDGRRLGEQRIELTPKGLDLRGHAPTRLLHLRHELCEARQAQRRRRTLVAVHLVGEAVELVAQRRRLRRGTDVERQHKVREHDGRLGAEG
mmetsp:Transcript_10408/g.31399  ORF Transcript_10408/g.31399 Transcript_10408/m.31399 type:complete len:271 (-) Transcript_10408:144-956(-)